MIRRSNALKALIDKLKRMHFGRMSEQLDRQIENLETRLGVLMAGGAALSICSMRRRARTSPRAARNRVSRVPLPPHLLREEIVLERDPPEVWH
ncbi:MAG: transposase [Burkholderia sp.]